MHWGLASMLLINCVFVLLLVPSSVFVAELVAGYVLCKKKSVSPKWTLGISSVVLVPAHNEAAVIRRTLENLNEVKEPCDEIIVVADNCDDDTASIARELGCYVLEREDQQRRGKGYALSFGIDYARENYEPEVLIFIDADCTVEASALQALKSSVVNWGAAVQGRYLLLPSGESVSAKQKISAFGVYLKNHIRTLGLDWLGGNVPITGSGFAIPFKVSGDLNLASGEIVEDMKLGIDLGLLGQKVQYQPHAHLESQLPESSEVSTGQRERWEHGHVGMITQQMPKLLYAGVSRARWRLLISALDMAVLPLSLQMAANLGFLFLALLLGLITGGFWPLMFVSLLMVLMVIALVLANSAAAAARLNSADIFGLVHYLFDKLKLYKKLFKGNKSGWIKTKRD